MTNTVEELYQAVAQLSAAEQETLMRMMIQQRSPQEKATGIMGDRSQSILKLMANLQNLRLLKEPVQIKIGDETQEKTYRVLKSDRGQILLSPIEQIPDHELWLWQNPSALNSVLRGIEQAAAGEVHDLGSFAEYADLEIE